MSRPHFLTIPFARTRVPPDSDPYHELFPAYAFIRAWRADDLDKGTQARLNRPSRRALSAGASDPDDVKIRYGVIVGVPRHDRNAVSDRGSSDPAIVDRRPAPRRAEPGDQKRPDFGHRLVHGEGFEPLRKLVTRQSAGGGLGILSLQHAEPQLPQRYGRDTPLEIPEATGIEPCSLKADKDGRLLQHQQGGRPREPSSNQRTAL